MRRFALASILLLAVIGAWQAVASLSSVDDLLLASPTEVARSLSSDRSYLADNAWVTFQEVALGLGIAIVVGALSAVLMHLVRPLHDAAYPLLVATQAVPIPVIAPLLVLAFDYGVGPKIAIVALVCFFPIAVNLADGLRSVAPEQLKLMRSLGASRLGTLRRVELPAALPYGFSGLKIAATVSVIAAVLGETAGANAGLGYAVNNDNHNLETPRAYAGVVLLAAMGVGLFALTALAERVAVPWNRQGDLPA
ncbi:MAG: putative hydroxymethylpyrimidine transport system permease protein [Thermoleophilaceae bacterium]|jgi:putative hydroxymethylpyrimidine transport system permease protein|nr:putative hydroxymethylpyrimidine transport system permease protein [Thermoleophilaceae bacterium]